MYKQAAKIDLIHPTHENPYMWFGHLAFDENGDGYYFKPLNGGILNDTEIVQGFKDDFEDRPRLTKPKS